MTLFDPDLLCLGPRASLSVAKPSSSPRVWWMPRGSTQTFEELEVLALTPQLSPSRRHSPERGWSQAEKRCASRHWEMLAIGSVQVRHQGGPSEKHLCVFCR